MLNGFPVYEKMVLLTYLPILGVRKESWEDVEEGRGQPWVHGQGQAGAR